LTLLQILTWADDYRARTGTWPEPSSGRVRNSDSDTWAAINLALYRGGRGLPGGSSLVRLLALARGRRNRRQLPSLNAKDVLAWADAHRARTGKWPGAHSGPIAEAPGETWAAINAALASRRRGLVTGGSLARLLALQRGKRIPSALPILTEARVLAWADAHHAQTGAWPNTVSGPVVDAPGEQWGAVDAALRYGRRGLPGKDSLARLLVRTGRVAKLWLKPPRPGSSAWHAVSLRPPEAASFEADAVEFSQVLLAVE
jgi:hypothetical protein